MDHPVLMSILRMRLGECFRLERLYGIYMRNRWPAGKLHADYGASARNAAPAPGQYYPVRENYMLSGFVTGAWNLTRHRSRRGRLLRHSRQPQEQFPDPRAHLRCPSGLPLREDRRGAGGKPHPVYRSVDPRHGPLRRRLRAAYAALQVLRVQHELGNHPRHRRGGHRTHASPAAVARRTRRSGDTLSFAVLRGTRCQLSR